MNTPWTLRLPAPLSLAALLAACGPAVLPRSPEQAPRSVEGTVIGIDNRSASEQLSSGLRITLQPEGRPTVLVELAPGWYLNQQGLQFSEQDRLHVEGRSRPGDPVFFASRVSKGDKSVTLRDPAGTPLWRLPEPGPSEK